MQSSTLMKVVFGCVLLFAGMSFFNFDYSFDSTVFDGNNVTKEFQLDDFHTISLSLPAHVKIKEGTSNTVKINAPEKLIDLINTDIKDGKWRIKLNKKMNWRTNSDIDIYVEMDDIRALAVAGSGEIETEDHFKNLNDVACAIAGSGDVILRANLEELDAQISGSGNFSLYGEGDSCDIQISGSGEIEAYEFETKNASVSISGSGEAYLNVSETLDARISGSGDVIYKGSPKVNSRVSGSGDIRSAK